MTKEQITDYFMKQDPPQPYFELSMSSLGDANYFLSVYNCKHYALMMDKKERSKKFKLKKDNSVVPLMSSHYNFSTFPSTFYYEARRDEVWVRAVADSDAEDVKGKFDIPYYIYIYSKTFLTKEQMDEILKEDFEDFKDKPKKKEASINLITATSRGFDTVRSKIKTPKLDLDLNYGKGFKKKSKSMIDSLKEDCESGLYLLHGIPGSGKSTYIKWLSAQVDKPFLWIPPNMSNILSNPDFIKFCLDNKDSVLLIEDAENIITERSGGNNQAVSNLLNMTDGILADALSMKIICTFNSSYNTIDKALKRPGRLKFEYKFDKLSIGDSQNVLDKLKKNYTATTEMTLAEIYNVDVDNNSQANSRTIGF